MPSPTATWFPWPSNQKAIQLQNPAPRICFVMSSLVPIVPIFNSLENRDEEKSIGANTKWGTRVQFLRSRHKWNREVRHGETVITRAPLLNLPQLQRCFFDFIGHLQRDCANLPYLETAMKGERDEGKTIYQLLLLSCSCVSLSKSIPWIWTLSNFRIVSLDN